jgi:growth hormone-inducible transmembrane protein
MAAIVGTGYLAQSIDYSNTLAKHAAWLLHTGVMGVVLAPMCLAGGPALFRAAWYTAGIVAGLSATAMCAPSEKFLTMAGPLSMGFGVVFVSCLGSFFFPPHTALGAGLASIVVYGGLILFSGFLLYDTQRVIKRAESTPTQGHSAIVYDQFGQEFPRHGMVGGWDPINAQLSIYMDVLNIFIRIAMMQMGSKRR